MSSNLITQPNKNQTLVSEKRVGRLEIVGYGLGNMGFLMSWTLVLYFLSYYYTDIIGISAGFVGIVMLIARILDGVTDIGMGYLIDRTNSKHGKARPYLLWLCIPFAIFTLALFTVPNIGTTGKHTYIMIVYILYNLLYTGVSISLKSLLGQITQDSISRSSLGVSLSIGFSFGGLVVATVSEPLASLIGGQKGWVIVVALISVISLITVYVSFKTTKERVVTKKDTDNNRVPLKLELKTLFKNKYWLIISIFGVSANVFYGVMAAEIYFARYIFGDAGYYSLIALVFSIAAIIIMPVLNPLVKRFGKQKTTLLAVVLIILSGVVKLIDPMSLICYLIGSVLVGAAIGIISATMYGMVNDTVDYGEWRSNIRSPGIVNSSMSFAIKVGSGLGGAIVGWLLANSGYVGSATQQTESATQIIIFLNVHMHIILGFIMLVIIQFYKLDKHYLKVIAELKNENKK